MKLCLRFKADSANGVNRQWQRLAEFCGVPNRGKGVHFVFKLFSAVNGIHIIIACLITAVDRSAKLAVSVKCSAVSF